MKFIRRCAAVLLVLIACNPAAPVRPQPESVAAGMRIFRTKGDCQSCHGWAADGRKMDSQMPDGANLRTTKLDRDKLIIAIKCGVPGKAMPAFDRLAYSDGRCYGMTQAALKKLGGPGSAGDAAAARDRIGRRLPVAKVVGKGPMDRAEVHRVLRLGRRSLQRTSSSGVDVSAGDRFAGRPVRHHCRNRRWWNGRRVSSP
jgi:mono/diheme cytochrome c family protein